nr:hypothetical protein [Tanacetum cinerariifolium]
MSKTTKKRTKELSSEALGVIAVRKMMKKPKTKHVSWLKHLVIYALEDEWMKDSRCSKHMTGNRKLFSTYKAYNRGNIIFGNNLGGNIIGKSEIVKEGKVIGRGIKKKGLYVMKLGNKPEYKICLATIDEHSTLWCRRLELLHMDLFGPSSIQSYGGKLYTLLIVDDYSREFDNEVQFGEFCNANDIIHNFSAPRTPQSNDVVERKNRTLQEMSRTMLNEQALSYKFWCNVVDTSTYILNQILFRAILEKTPYELLRGRKPNLDYFKVFGSKITYNVPNKYNYSKIESSKALPKLKMSSEFSWLTLTKFDLKSYEGIFLGYSQNSKAYIILNKHTMKIKESLNVTFDETPPFSKTDPLVDDVLDEEEAAIKVTEKKNLENDIEDETLKINEVVNIKKSRNHPLENVIENLNQRTLRSQA